MRYEQLRDPERFCREVELLLSARPAANSKMRRAAARIERDPDGGVMMLLSDGDLVLAAGAASGTDSPLFADALSTSAMRALAREAAQRHPGLKGITAPTPLAEAFAAEWWLMTGHRNRVRLRLQEYALREDALVEPKGSHRIRLAGEEDLSLVEDWQRAFLTELHMPDDLNKALFRATERVNAREMSLLVDPSGVAVCMVGHNAVSSLESRIAPVYTAPAHRRRGCAREAVARVCRALFAEGKRAVYLAANADDPGANALYQGMGFCGEGEQCHLEFMAPA
jgi:ribosomal protein S18 acetylase RimI-like enzyme